MKKEFVKYTESIGITKALRKRIDEIYQFYQKICPDEIIDIFVSDYVTKDGLREYEHLYFFSAKYCMEAKQFIIKDDFEITPIQKRIDYYTIHKQDYNFEKATEKSRCYLKFELDTATIKEFIATKENCDYLKSIILKHVIPNLKE